MCRQTNKPAACCACSAAAAGSEPLGCEGVCASDRLLGGWLCSAPSSGAPPHSCRRPAASAGSRSPPSERPESDHTLLREERGKKGGIRKGEGGKGGDESRKIRNKWMRKTKRREKETMERPCVVKKRRNEHEHLIQGPHQ